MARKQLTVLYIASIGHSGSTLLDLLLAAHPQITSVGEVMFLRGYAWAQRKKSKMTPLGNECTCGSVTISKCHFWQRVDQRLQQERRLSLRDLDIQTEHQAEFDNHNSALFQTLSAVTGTSIFVDSSKNPRRLARLRRIDGMEVKVVYLHRNEFGVVRSQLRKGFGLIKSSLGVVLQTYRLHHVLKEAGSHFVEYGDLVSRPEPILKALMDGLEIPFAAEQLRWSEGEKHLIGGNRMRRSKSNEIRADNSWKQALSLFQKIVIAVLVWPAMWMATSIRGR